RALRDAPAGALVPPPRRRADGPADGEHVDVDLRVQGPRDVLLRRLRRRGSRHHLDLRRPAARGGTGPRPRLLLRRADRPEGRRGRRPPPLDALVLSPRPGDPLSYLSSVLVLP